MFQGKNFGKYLDQGGIVIPGGGSIHIAAGGGGKSFPSKSIPWDDPKSDPIQDLIDVARASYDNAFKQPFEGYVPQATFHDEISAAEPVPTTVPLDDAGRPVLDDSGGMARPVGVPLCPAHGLEMRGGRCKRCR